MKYIPVIGLEIHAELLTSSKVFCGCANEFGGRENSRVCSVCMAMPGTIPVLNKNAVTLAVRAGISVDCTINNYSAFDRKNYFYPDSPKAYQITQFEYPICTNGHIDVAGKKIRINRIHIEEDAGKLIHDEDVSMVDYNRCGVPLIEIVTEPDFGTIEEVQSFVEEIALRLKYAGVCDVRMEQGSMRVDVNVSIMPEGDSELGTRAEIKNLNSIRSIRRAIEYEIKRQSELLDIGERVIQETRRFDDSNNTTSSLRSKEVSNDYRYFPEPDVPPILISEDEIEKIRESMPEMPQERLIKYTKEYGLPEDDAKLIIANKALSDFYDETVEIHNNYKSVCNIILVELLRNMNEASTSVEEFIFSPNDLAKLVKMSDDGIVSKNAAKDILKIMFVEGKKPMDIAKEKKLIMNSNEEEIESIIDNIISKNPKSVQSYKDGKDRVFGFFMGEIMKAAGKGVNPKLAKDLLKEKLK